MELEYSLMSYGNYLIFALTVLLTNAEAVL